MIVTILGHLTVYRYSQTPKFPKNRFATCWQPNRLITT